MTTTATDIPAYHAALSKSDLAICQVLHDEINRTLPEAQSKIWHRHPVWFLDGNPVVGYAKLKDCIQLLFWSGQSFAEPGLQVEGTFKAAQARFTAVDQIDTAALRRWLEKARSIQWDYKNIVKHRGVLERIK
jgi:hypothetical protein